MTIKSDVQPLHSVPQPSRRIIALDGLRGVAAILVLLHHSLLMLPDFANYEWNVAGARAYGPIEWLLLRTPMRLMWAGQERAILFFVLSGFVLGVPWLDGKAAPYGKFLLGRFCRIYPPYLIAMAFAAVGSILLGGHALDHASIYFNQLGWAFPASWGAIPSTLAVMNDPVSAYMNEAVWSLVWEVRVALIFPLLMVAIVRWRNTGALAMIVVLFGLQHLGEHYIGRATSELLNAPQDTFYFAQFFVLGAVVALNRSTITAWFSRRDERYGLACLMLGCLICWAPWPHLHHRIVGFGAAIIIVSILGSASLRRWLEKRSLLWLGKQSYSLYLIHVPLIMIVVIAFAGSVPVWAVLGIIPITLVVAQMFHRWLELPSVTLAQRWTRYPGQRTSPSVRTSMSRPALQGRS
jgi:peptidoglycan/LPS O-acetylase OafA/YrhL